MNLTSLVALVALGRRRPALVYVPSWRDRPLRGGRHTTNVKRPPVVHDTGER
jgi:hypothetical protein